MKKKVLSIIIMLVLLLTSVAYATEEVMKNDEPEIVMDTTSEEVIQPEYQIIEKSYSMFDENANLQNAIINGNIFAFGLNVNLKDVVVYGDIFIAGSNIILSNVTVYGTAFLAGETINMDNAKFAGNIFGASQTINFTGVAQDVFAAAENININEETIIMREIFASAKKIALGGNIQSNAYLSVDELTLLDNINILGKLKYSAYEEANLPSQSNIGDVEFEKVEENQNQEDKNLNKIATAGIIASKVYNVVVLLVKSIFICGFIFLFAKGFMEKQKNQNVISYIGKNALKGFGWLVLIPIIAILFLCSGVAVGLSIMIFTIYFIILWLGVPIIAITISANIKSKGEDSAWKNYGKTILIALLISILKQLPYIGGIVTFVVSIAAMGIIISSLKNKKNIAEKVEQEVIQ